MVVIQWCKFCRNASRPFLLFSWNAYHSITFTRTFGLPLWVVQIYEELTCWRGRFLTLLNHFAVTSQLNLRPMMLISLKFTNIMVQIWCLLLCGSQDTAVLPAFIQFILVKSVSCVFLAARSGLTQEKQLYPKKNTMYRHQTFTIMPARICRFQWYQHREHSA